MTATFTIRPPITVYAVCVLLLSLLASPANAQNKDKISSALEAQIACKEKPQVAKAIGTLQKNGMIERREYLNSDSISYFRVRRPLSVWGLKVVSVFGFDQSNPRVFQRGPGTAPPVTLGVVVAASTTTVQSTLELFNLKQTKFESAAELDLSDRPGSRSRSKPLLTSLFCEERY
jgi:hypothetical protein